MKENSRNKNWGIAKSILGVGMVIGFFLPWLGGCSPQNGLDLVFSPPMIYRDTENYSDIIAIFPSSYDKVVLVGLLVIGAIIFCIGMLNATGLFTKVSSFANWLGLLSSFFSIKFLIQIITLKYRSSLYDSIELGLPIMVLCSVGVVLLGLGEDFSSPKNPPSEGN